MGTFSDKHSQWLIGELANFRRRVYDTERGFIDIENNMPEIVNYLGDKRLSSTLGLCIRRYLCTKFAQRNDNGSYTFCLSNDTLVTVGDFKAEGYDIKKDDIDTYILIFNYINAKYNTDESGKLSPELNRTKIKGWLTSTSDTQRKKMFELSFVLHMNNEEMHKFLCDFLALQTYNTHNPEELIAFFCQSHEEYNSYPKYLQLLADYKAISNKQHHSKTEGYSAMTKTIIPEMDTVEELMTFLSEHTDDFKGYSVTAYNEFMSMIDYIWGYLNEPRIVMDAKGEIKEVAPIVIDRSKTITAGNERLAEELLDFIPRANSTAVVKGEKVTLADFIHIVPADSANTEKRNTLLNRDITSHALTRDRLDHIMKKKIPVDRKDLVFLKFYSFYVRMAWELDKEKVTPEDCEEFMQDCNNMLERCGMSRLYIGNRYENLIMLSFFSSNPYEVFTDIIEESFFNMPEFF